MPEGKDPRKCRKYIAYWELLKRKDLPGDIFDVLVSDYDVIKSLCECSKNLLLCKVPLHKKEYHRLRKYRHQIRKLANKDIPFDEKEIILKQSVGSNLLPTLLPPVLELFNTLLSK